ncbi:MAG: isoprenyl transferase [Pseudomonadota bacterium]
MSKSASPLPYHVAVIMDGNGRWAEQRLSQRIKGHREGVESVRVIARSCREIGIKILTLYAFSTENWNRPKHEIMSLMLILKRFLASELKEMMTNGIRLNTIGQIDRLPVDVQSVLEETKAATCHNSNMLLNLALSYGGRDEIARAAQLLALDVQKGVVDPADIIPQLFSEYLYTRDMPDPDLLIRTSGEMRISNFLLWQMSYTEIYFTDVLWPDFRKEHLLTAIKAYQERDRRFGMTGEQKVK